MSEYANKELEKLARLITGKEVKNKPKSSKKKKKVTYHFNERKNRPS